MEEIYNNIIEAEENLEEVFEGIGNRTLQDYYALFISEMAYCGYISIKPSFAAKIYVNILNTTVTNVDEYLTKIYDFLFDKMIKAFEREELNETGNT